MASITNFFDEKWSRRIQLGKKANSVAYSVSNLEEVENLKSGDRVNRPKAFDFVVDNYSRTADQNLQAVETDNEYVDINHQKQVSFYIDKLDETQSKYSLAGEAIDRAVYRIANEIDQTRFKETLNANYTADDGTIGGTPGNAISTVSSNFYKLFPSIKGILANAKVETDRPWYAVVSPEVVAGIEITALDKGFQKADSTMEAGYKGNFGGFRIYESTNLSHTVLLTASTGNTDGKKLTIAGVELTFTTAGTGKNEAKASATAATAAANLCDLINNTNGTNDGGLSAEALAIFKNNNITATVSGAAITLSSTGYVSVDKGDSDMTPSAATCYNEFGRMGAVDLVTQLKPFVQMNKEPKRTGYTYLIVDLYGVKTFEEGKQRMVKVKTVPVLS